MSEEKYKPEFEDGIDIYVFSGWSHQGEAWTPVPPGRTSYETLYRIFDLMSEGRTIMMIRKEKGGGQIHYHITTPACCSCERNWKDLFTVYPHIVPLDKKARWKVPALGNIFAGEFGQAVALQCNGCFKDHSPILYAVEFQPDIAGLPGKNIVYHKLDTLESF